MATARRTGTNEQITTYGSPSRTFDDGEFSVWEAATDTDHVADTETDVLECFDDQASFDDQLVIGGSTNDSSFFRIIRPASGEGHDGTSNNGFTIDSTANINVITISETFFQLQDIIISFDFSSASGRYCISLASGGADTAIVGCILFDIVNSGSGVGSGMLVQSNNVFNIIDCLINNADDVGIVANKSGGLSMFVFNCTITDCGGNGLQTVSNNQVKLVNVLSDGSGAVDFTGTFNNASNHNASGDTTAPGTDSRISQTFTFVNAAGDDFHLDAADAGADNFGVDLSGDSDYDFDDDIDGDLFNTWDIGFDENSVVAAVAVPNVFILSFF